MRWLFRVNPRKIDLPTSVLSSTINSIFENQLRQMWKTYNMYSKYRKMQNFNNKYFKKTEIHKNVKRKLLKI